MSRSYFGRWFFLLALLLLLPWSVWGGEELAVSASRHTLTEGESFDLTIILGGKRETSPDWTSLEKDFEILGTSQSNRIQILNGQMETHIQWRITLTPKRIGELTIPSLVVAKQKSQEIPITVLPAGQQAPRQSDTEGIPPLRVEVEVSPAKVYQQAQVRYRVRIYYQTEVELREAELSEPKPSDAVVVRMGEDKQYTAQVHGEHYKVVERNYALFPQKTGTLKIPPVTLTAQVTQRHGWAGGHDPLQFFGLPQGSLLDPFGNSRPVKLLSKTEQVEVLPAPVQAPSPWLPSTKVTLTESWSPASPHFRVGEPVTRTLTLEAIGQDGKQIPPFLLSNTIVGMKYYADQPQFDTKVQQDSMIGRRIEKLALIPAQPGTITLPEIRVPWWNIKENRAEVAILPSQVIQVAPGTQTPSQGSQPPLAIPKATPTLQSSSPAQADLDLSPSHTQLEHSPNMDNISSLWRYLAFSLLGLWLFTLVGGVWLYRSLRRGSQPFSGGKDEIILYGVADSQFKQQFQAACQGNHTTEIRRLLLLWAQGFSEPYPRSLIALAAELERESSDLASLIRQLDCACYGIPNRQDFSDSTGGKKLYDQMKPFLDRGFLKRNKKVGFSSPLPPLVPR